MTIWRNTGRTSPEPTGWLNQSASDAAWRRRRRASAASAYVASWHGGLGISVL